MTTNTEVKVFQNITGTDAGVPQLSGTAGALITVLDACLVNGYGSVTLDSLVVASNVATCTKSTGHGFTALGTVGPVIRITGATPSGLNADWRITVVSSTVFTFVTTGISDQTATGTIAAKRAPAGFSKEFSATNKAAYRSDDVAGTRLYLRVADDGTGSAKYARVRGYEVMSDVDTGTGPFPTDAQFSGGLYLWKSDAASSAVRPWRIISDTRSVYILVKVDNAYWYGGSFFGDILSYKISDSYSCGIIANDSSSAYGNTYLHSIALAKTASYLARTYAGTGASIGFGRLGHWSTTYIGNGSLPYPNPVSGFFHATQIEVWESSSVLRGLMPGFYGTLHPSASITDNTVINGVTQLSGKSLWNVLSSTIVPLTFDITGPWV